MEVKDRIIQKANELFFRFGIKTVTMDDIAQELGVSKKTIYQHFEDKDEIVYQVMSQNMEQDKCDFDDIMKCSSNIIESMVKMTNMMREQLSSINPSLFFDIKKFHPRSWKLWQDHKHNFVLGQIKKELQQGIEEGFIRSEINIEILSLLRLEQIELGFDNQVFPPNKFNSIVEIQLTFLDNFVRGVLTQKGLELYEKSQINKAL